MEMQNTKAVVDAIKKFLAKTDKTNVITQTNNSKKFKIFSILAFFGFSADFMTFPL
jgi:hypothetical protein